MMNQAEEGERRGVSPTCLRFGYHSSFSIRNSSFQGLTMRTPLILLALLAWSGVVAAKDEAPAYSIKIDPGSVVSAIRDRDGKAGRYVSLQFQIRRFGVADEKAAIVTTVTKEEIRVDEDGQKVLELELFQPR